jgi:uncharacterized protein YchJ
MAAHTTASVLLNGGRRAPLALAARPPPPSAVGRRFVIPAVPAPHRLASDEDRTTTTNVAAAASKGFAPKKESSGGGGFGGGGKSSSSATSSKQQKQSSSSLPDPANPCPCGSGATYGLCCQPAHAGRAAPSTPEKLLRSRFSAYRLGLVDYLVATTHPKAPERRSAALGLASSSASVDAAQQKEAYRASIARTAKSTDFVALAVDKAGADVRNVKEGEEEAFLSFRVWYRSKGGRGSGGGGGGGGGESVVRETSHFVKGKETGNRWMYLGEAQETGGEEGKRLAEEAGEA